MEVGEEEDTLVFSLRQSGITKVGHDKITLEMFAFICKAYIELQGGKIRGSELDEGEALVQFSLPK